MSIEKRGSFELAKSLRKFKGQKTTLPRKLSNTILKHFLEGFRKGGFTDVSFTKWIPRWKRLTRKRISRKVKEPATLIKSGALRRSIKVKNAVWDYIKVSTSGIRYAFRHNIGEIDRLGRPMPKRQFIGNSKQLDKKIEKQLITEIDKVFV